MSRGPSASHAAGSATGLGQERKPLSKLSNRIRCRRSCCFTHSWPLKQILIGYGTYVPILMKASPREVVHVEDSCVHGDRLSGEIERHAAPRPTPLLGLEGARLLLRDANDHDAG